MERVTVTETDVLVIGGGAAACAAAIETSKYGLKTMVVDKGIVGRSGSSPTSGAGINAAFGHTYPEGGEGVGRDSPQAHFDDTRMVGGEINDPRLVNDMVQGIEEAILESETWGVNFNKGPDGRFRQLQTLGNRFPRSVVGVGGGPRFMEALRKEVLHRRVHLFENRMIVGLHLQEGCVCGALGFDIRTGRWCFHRAKAVILAAGSATDLYRFASANYRTTGDALALAYKAGARLANMEFVEFTVVPKVGNAIISSGGISPFVGLGSHIVNNHGERFLRKYDPERMERTSRAILARAIFLELREGRGPVFNDASHLSEEAWRELEKTDQPRLRRLTAAGLDYRREGFEWVPAVHTFLGGIVIDPECFTGVPGLFAAGECTNSIHGADRLSGNALSECLFFGKRAGKSASVSAISEKAPLVDGDEIKAVIKRYKEDGKGRGEAASSLKKRLRDIAWDHLGVVRTADSLEKGLEKISEIKQDPGFTGSGGSAAETVEIFEAKNLTMVAEVIGKSALMRRESRGQHFREDFPKRDDAQWKKWIVVRKGKDGSEWEPLPVPKLD